MSAHADKEAVERFVARWKNSAAAERANYQLFLGELCELLGVPRPEPAQADDERNAYVFERAVTFHNGDGSTSTGRIDLYRRGCFVLEAKQGSERASGAGPLSGGAPGGAPRRARRGAAVRGSRGWDVAMREARGQAEQYVRALPPEEGNPPFVVTTDVGYSIELYSDFSRSGKTYVPFPDSRSHRVLVEDLAREEVRERLRLVWEDPLALDPGRQSARVTREMAERLAALARSLEAAGHAPERVAHFLMRVIFTSFAEDMRLLPERGWTDLLESLGGSAGKFPAMVSSLWETMNAGGFSPILRETLPRFNGGLFESVEALPVTEEQLGLLAEAGRLDWRDVEPAIFGTLLERALDPRERHTLGAHYTPRAYVERLVMPAVIEPLREEWEATLVAAVKLHDDGRDAEAAATVKEFHRRLCRVRVLDPACGTGNFLYVTLEHLKRLEGEVLDALHGFGERQGLLEDAGLSVDPGQLLGVEKNPRAAAIADLVLWIGYLQWHFRTRGDATPPEPVLKRFGNIETRDAVLAHDGVEAVTDDEGRPLTRWDGRTFKRHPVTGEDVPDETARVPVLRYLNPRPADWPEADFVVGNPPFIGARRIRLSLGDEYVETLRAAYAKVPETVDYVMFWWHKAAEAVAKGVTKRFGFITTNSIVQPYSRGLIEEHLNSKQSVRIVFAIPDHPWVEAADGAAVRVAMTVAAARGEYKEDAALLRVIEEDGERVVLEQKKVGFISASLKSAPESQSIEALQSNQSICFQGVVPAGDGFKLEIDELVELGFDKNELPPVIRNYIIGRDLVQHHQPKYIIDFFGLTEVEARTQWPALYQRLLNRVYPERRENKRAAYREKWWIFAEPRPAMRLALAGLRRYIATPYTAKHRPFIFVDNDTLPDAMVYAITSDDAFMLGVLSSRIHACWALSAGGRLGVGNDPRYTSKTTFSPFPFPDCDEQQKARVRELGEQLDAHRKRRQAEHPGLTLTEMYNVLEKLRAGEPLSERERATHERGLVSVLRQLHDELDAAVADAYGWPAALTDEEILERLVRLNAERAVEERRGLVRWLRPEYQKPAEGVAAAFGDEFEAAAPARAGEKRQEWPRTLPEQARALRQALAARPGVVTPKQLAARFVRARVERVEELLQTLVSLGQAREVGPGRFAA
ncbi:MAG TPA: DNA methyltransferase [Pyrinomonadaceae bacterium]|nr:DNA methyltransferase [Pyrinomonadaceae bacterium]